MAVDPDNKGAVLDSFAAWLQREGEELPQVKPSDWDINPYRTAYLIAPSEGRRSNRLYLVRGNDGVAFAPSAMRIEDAYAKLLAGGE
ncbi:MAG: hypothetical protein Q4C87_02705 [Actinomycetaceae bacterium]|nr:hypothetical protein [Actinomycetaceae bacterium]